MDKEIYCYRFCQTCPAREIEETIQLAVLAAECLHGPSRVRLEASYCMDEAKNACVINATTDVGRDIARFFTGFAIREFGEESFTVRRGEDQVNRN